MAETDAEANAEAGTGRNVRPRRQLPSEDSGDVALADVFDGRGCPRHARDVMYADREQGGTIGAAILYSSAVRQRIGELDGLRATGGLP